MCNVSCLILVLYRDGTKCPQPTSTRVKILSLIWGAEKIFFYVPFYVFEPKNAQIFKIFSFTIVVFNVNSYLKIKIGIICLEKGKKIEIESKIMVKFWNLGKSSKKWLIASKFQGFRKFWHFLIRLDVKEYKILEKPDINFPKNGLASKKF